MPYKVSVVTPALNEAKNIVGAIQNILDGFKKAQIKGEIIAVNDGSSDDTFLLLRQLSQHHPNITVISHAEPMGIGRSFWDGVSRAQGEIVTLLPGDGENDAFEVLRYVPLLDSVDLVIPFVFNQGTRSPLRQLLSRVYRSLVNFSFGLSIEYFNGTVLYRRSALNKINLMSSGFFYQTEILIKCLSNGYLYAEVPCGLKKREMGESKAIRPTSITRVIGDFLRLYLQMHLGKIKEAELATDSMSYARKLQFPNSQNSEVKSFISPPVSNSF